jgi:hypothetical protein
VLITRQNPPAPAARKKAWPSPDFSYNTMRQRCENGQVGFRKVL